MNFGINHKSQLRINSSIFYFLRIHRISPQTHLPRKPRYKLFIPNHVTVFSHHSHGQTIKVTMA
uniref:Uncharacterized protein n=1 Tax=Solanum lycopersicum TaxID=4081 RepID=A0A3Q7I2S4_SOLLC